MSRRYGSFSQESPRSLDRGSGSWGNGHQASMGSWSVCYSQYDIFEATHRHCDDGCLVRLRIEEEGVSRVWTMRIGAWIGGQTWVKAMLASVFRTGLEVVGSLRGPWYLYPGTRRTTSSMRAQISKHNREIFILASIYYNNQRGVRGIQPQWWLHIHYPNPSLSITHHLGQNKPVMSPKETLLDHSEVSV